MKRDKTKRRGEKKKGKENHEAFRDGKGQKIQGSVENNNADTAFPGLIQS
jgi:hypothetical protein